MKKLIMVFCVATLTACETDVTPADKEFVLPTESVDPIEITLPYQGDGIQVELVKEVSSLVGEDPLDWSVNRYYINEQKVLSYYYGHIYKSNDGGESWEPKFELSGGTSVVKPMVSDLRLVSNNSKIGFAAGFTTYRYPGGGGTPNGWIAITKDEGEHWEVIHEDISHSFHSVFPLASKPGVLIVAGSGIIIRSSDFGKTWSTVYEGDQAGVLLSALSYQGIFSLTDRHLYLNTSGGQLISTDYGLTWKAASTDVLSRLQSVHAKRGNGGKVYGAGYYTASEEYWHTKIFQTRFSLEDLQLITDRQVYEAADLRHNLECIVTQPNGMPVFMGISHVHPEKINGSWPLSEEIPMLSLVFPHNSKWHPLVLKWEQNQRASIGKICSVDRGYYLFIGFSSNGVNGAKLIKVTFP
jgi:hypothetical protein